MRRRLAILHAGLCAAALLLGSPSSQADPAPTMPLVTMRVLAGTDPSVLDDLVNVLPVKGKAPAALQVDLAHHRVLNAQGQTVVEFTSGKPISLQGTVDKWRYAAAFGRMATAHNQEIHINWGARAERPGQLPFLYDQENTDLVLTNVTPGRQLVVFAFDASGIIGLLYVTGAGGGKVSGDTVVVPIRASAPFGVDHVVAISAVEPVRLMQFASWLAETALAHGMLDSEGSVLEEISQLREVRVGLLSLYTCRSARDCGR